MPFYVRRVDVQERLLSGRFVEGRGRGSHTSVCGGRWVWSGRARDHYAIATGSTVVEKTGNCPHESKIKAFFANRDRIELNLSRKNV